MDSHRLKHILTIVDTAISLSPANRSDYLTEVCGRDESLRNEVLALLKSIDKSEAFWNEWQDWNNEHIQHLFREEIQPGKDIHPVQAGPWHLVKLLGRGGMGNVFLAERSDGQYEQKAAVKLLLHGLERGESLRRFKQERQILAKLDHPHLARFYDGGVTTDGRPWLAMQYIDGLSINRWCRQQGCNAKERLKLFANVCEAVRYAHKNLIVHRDLKPDNILVSKEGVVKVLDFGIAKLIDEELTEAKRIQTQTGLRVMSLDYAAPEQIVGESITTATDVYALGLLLYELLAETYPFDLQDKSQLQIEQILRNQDPQKPSSVNSRWQSELNGDLDAIILKALRKEPDQRYENAGQLLQDIERYNLNMPVSARVDTIRYRVGKFCRRYYKPLAAGIGVLLSVISLITYYTYQITQERNRAQQEAVKAEEVSGFLEDLFNASDPFMAAETGRPDTLRVRGFLKRGADKVQNELHNQPLVQARMQNVVGEVYINLGLFDDALPLLKQSLATRSKNGSPEEIARAHESIARALQRKGDLSGAEQHYRKALKLRQTHDLRGRKKAATMVKLAALLTDKSAYDESELLFKEALYYQKTHLGETHADVAETLRNLGIFFHRQAVLDSAEFYYTKSLAIHKELHGDKHLDVAQNLLNLSTLLREKGDYEAAEPFMKEILNIQQNVLGSEHPSTVTTMYELAILLRDKKEPRLQEAADLFHRVIELDKKQRGKYHHFVGLDLAELGITQNKMHALEDAKQTYKQSLSVLRRALPEGHPDISVALTGLGDTLIRDNKAEEAIPLLQKALQIRLNKFGEKAWRTGVSKSALGWAFMMQGRYDEAEKLLLDGYITLRNKSGPLQAAIARLVMLYEQKGEEDKAKKYQALLSKATY